jgi:3-methyl-2-oxobutanoate hydroxymethyltransferase
MLGLDLSFTPKFAKHFLEAGVAVAEATRAYVGEVKAGTFPADEHSFHSSSVRLVPPPVEEEAEEPHGGVVGTPV